MPRGGQLFGVVRQKTGNCIGNHVPAREHQRLAEVGSISVSALARPVRHGWRHPEQAPAALILHLAGEHVHPRVGGDHRIICLQQVLPQHPVLPMLGQRVAHCLGSSTFHQATLECVSVFTHEVQQIRAGAPELHYVIGTGLPCQGIHACVVSQILRRQRQRKRHVLHHGVAPLGNSDALGPAHHPLQARLDGVLERCGIGYSCANAHQRCPEGGKVSAQCGNFSRIVEQEFRRRQEVLVVVLLVLLGHQHLVGCGREQQHTRPALVVEQLLRKLRRR
ncbi:hypothetical protein D3C72_1338620 [compost metagenome]